MDSLFFYLETWFLPMLIVVLIYMFFLIPTYFLVKKYKPSYWLMIGFSVLGIYALDILFFYLVLISGYRNFYLDLFGFSFLVNFLFFVFLPLLIGKIFKFELKRNKFIISYFVLFSLQIIIVCFAAYWMAAGVGKFFMTLG
jgi:hypothetical protein